MGKCIRLGHGYLSGWKKDARGLIIPTVTGNSETALMLKEIEFKEAIERLRKFRDEMTRRRAAKKKWEQIQERERAEAYLDKYVRI